ncbi:hypothetical protein [Streptomyces flaveus]
MKLIQWTRDRWRRCRRHITSHRLLVILEIAGLLVAVMMWAPWR